MFTYKYLLGFTKSAFMKMGCSVEDSDVIAEVFLAAELRGHSSHGMLRLKDYYELWKSGRINVSPAVKVVYESPAVWW